MWDFSIARALGLMLKTMPFIVFRVLVYAGIAVAYVLVSIGAAVRIWGPLALPTHYTGTLAAAAGIWGLAFVLFVLRYTPILLGPRADAAGEH